MEILENLATPLQGNWRHLAFLNYEVDGALLLPYVPRGVELDDLDGRCLVSLVGLLFSGTALFGIPDPFHQVFEQVNFRFYVRRHAEEGWRHGTVFIKEIVPASLMAAAARALLNEPYEAMQMRHTIEETDGMLRPEGLVEYGWRFGEGWDLLTLRRSGEARQLAPGSREEFVTMRLWGYSRQRDGGTIEYRIDHPRWLWYEGTDAELSCDVQALYGSAFAPTLNAPPAFAHIAIGSHFSLLEAHRLC